jgi:hypothetical protein
MNNELNIVSKFLPIEANLSKYLCIKTKINYLEDFTFRMAVQLEQSILKFYPYHHEMKPLVVGIKCYNTDPSKVAYVDVYHNNRNYSKTIVIDSFTVENEKWYPFKFPLVDSYHSETKINLMDVKSFTLAIMNTSQRVREDNYTNNFPYGYNSIFLTSNMYGSFNPPIIYYDDNENIINPFNFNLVDAVIIPSIKFLEKNKDGDINKILNKIKIDLINKQQPKSSIEIKT